jgi:signal transduction histidine kinase
MGVVRLLEIIGVLLGIGAVVQFGGVLRRRAATRRVEAHLPRAHADVLPLLREISGFLESGGEPHSVLQLLAKRLCDGVFDSCVIDVDPDRGPKPLAVVACSDRTPLPLEALTPDRVLPTTSDTVVLDARAIATDDRLTRVFGETDTRSVILTPVISRGMVFGVLAFGTAADQPAPHLVELASEIGVRLGCYVHRLRLEQEVSAAQQVKSDFLAVMSHELKTPLNIILGYADLLLVGLPVPIPAESRPHLERLRSSARDLLARLEEILAFARMDDEPEEPDLEEIDVTSVAREVVSALRPVAQQRSLTLNAENTRTPVSVITDRSRLTQILYNLVSNAVRFTNLGSIEIAVRQREDGGATVTVVDTGIGISPDHIDQIYEPFWQINRSATRTVGGLGLGLAIARSLAMSIGAQLHVSSNVGHGTTFSLELPARGPEDSGTRGA